MMWCNGCDVLLFMKRDLVREMKKGMKIFGDIVAKINGVSKS